jgi:hypothetical protein
MIGLFRVQFFAGGGGGGQKQSKRVKRSKKRVIGSISHVYPISLAVSFPQKIIMGYINKLCGILKASKNE